MRTARFDMELPPSNNNFYTVSRGRKILSAAARMWRDSVVPKICRDLAMQQEWVPICSPEQCMVTIHFTPPDRRRRDIDGVIKHALDAMTRAGVYEDDSLVSRLYVVRHPASKGLAGLNIIVTMEHGDAGEEDHD